MTVQIWHDDTAKPCLFSYYTVEFLSEVWPEHLDSVMLLDAAANEHLSAKIYGIGIRRMNYTYDMLTYDLNESARTGREFEGWDT